MTKRIHAAALIPPSTGLIKTWCGLLVNTDQTAELLTDRAVNCLRCARSGVKRNWPLGANHYWRSVIRRAAARAAIGGGA